MSESTLASFQTLHIVETELSVPPSDCFLRHHDSPFGEQILDISDTNAESVVLPDCMTDDFGRKTVTMIVGSCGFHAASLAVIGPS